MQVQEPGPSDDAHPRLIVPWDVADSQRDCDKQGLALQEQHDHHRHTERLIHGALRQPRCLGGRGAATGYEHIQNIQTRRRARARQNGRVVEIDEDNRGLARRGHGLPDTPSETGFVPRGVLHDVVEYGARNGNHRENHAQVHR